jgi:hypothetical protein
MLQQDIENAKRGYAALNAAYRSGERSQQSSTCGEQAASGRRLS